MTQTFGRIRWGCLRARVYSMPLVDGKVAPALEYERSGFLNYDAAWKWAFARVTDLGEVRGDDEGNFTEAAPAVVRIWNTRNPPRRRYFSDVGKIELIVL